jgi:pimeloyl-ACP methyl ester carboxylesterase
MKRLAFVLSALVALVACVPNRSFRANESVFRYRYPDDGHFFRAGRAALAYIEFDDKGNLFPQQHEVERALKLIDDFQKYDREANGGEAKGVVVFVFVHGWKNNASEESGNVWGFRKTLDEFAVRAGSRHLVGVYIGWPGVGWPGGDPDFTENVSFWNRKKVAKKVGGTALTGTLEQIMQKTKGTDYSGKSSCILVGHSFGGLALEGAVTPILRKSLDAMTAGDTIKPPADLIVLLNEAAPALIAKPFLCYLAKNNVSYVSDNEKPHPLLLSMTSVGDVVTKFVFPVAQLLSFHQPNFPSPGPPDRLGIPSEKTYYTLTTANMIALQNYQFIERKKGAEPPPKTYISPKAGHLTFDLAPKESKNATPYWVMQLPQVFVPDHGAVFGVHMIDLLEDLLWVRNILSQPSSESMPVAKAREQVSNPAAPGSIDIRLRKGN